MQNVKNLILFSLCILVHFWINQAWGQCTPPPALAAFQCSGCAEIQIFYCEEEAQPATLSSFIQQNSNYQAGASLNWYADNNGLISGQLTAEPSPDVSTSQTQYYWVSQVQNGCEGTATRLRLRVRPRPWLEVDSSIQFCYPYQMDMTGQVVDRRNVSSIFQYYDTNPASGASPTHSLTATAGQLNPPNQSIFIAPPIRTTYWVIGVNEATIGPGCRDTASFTLVPNTRPQVTPNPDIYICEGQIVSPPPVQSTPSASLILWTINNKGMGLASSGFGNPPAFLAPTGITKPDTAQLTYFVLSGVCASIDTVNIYLQPKPRITIALADTVCSRQSGQISLSISNQVPGLVSYQWLAPSLQAGLQGPSVAGNGPRISGTFVNEENGMLAATYQVRATSEIGCVGPVEVAKILTKAEPVISTTLDTDICSSEEAQLAFSTQNQLAGVTFSWTSNKLTSGLVGLQGAPTSSSGPLLNDAFLNTSGKSLAVNYQLQAEADGCQAIPQSFALDVYPILPTGSLVLIACEDATGSGQASFNLMDVNSQIIGNPITDFFLDPQLTLPVSSPQNFQSNGQIIYGARYGSAPCPENWRIQLNIQSIPAIPTAIQDAGCQGTHFQLSPSPGNAFRFYDADPASGIASLLQDQATTFDTLLLDPSSPVEIWMSAYDGLCESQASKAEIEVWALPDLFNISSNSPLCEGDNLELQAATAHVSTFSWSSANPSFSGTDSIAQLENISLSDAGMFHLEITNSHGCSYADSVQVVVVLPPNAGQDTVVNFCDGDAAFRLFDALGAGASSGGFWTGPSLVGSGYLGSFDPANMTFGTYTYNLTGHACQAAIFARVEVAYFPIPSPVMTANSPLFEDDDLQLQATDGLYYLWAGPNGFGANGDQVIRSGIALEDSGYYVVEVTNAGGCVGKDSVFVQVIEVPKIQFALAAFLEGPFDGLSGLMHDSLRKKGVIPLTEPFTAMNFNFVGGGGERIDPQILQQSGPDAIVDWIFVDLRDPNDSMLTVASRACLLQRDGDIVDLDGVSPPTFRWLNEGFYYVVIDHRNHLSVMTAMPVYLDKAGNIFVDFRDVATPVFGFNPVKRVGNEAFLFSGDANGDDQVQVIDLVNFWIPSVGTSGYIHADWNLDGQVQNNDFISIWVPNAGRGSQVPGKAF